jgi:hypothetical protein
MNKIENEDKVTLILAQEINGGGLGYKILSYDVFREIAKKILSEIDARVTPTCAICGDPIIVGVCENCEPDIMQGIKDAISKEPRP